MGNVDIVILTETKLDDSYPSSQYLIPRFSEPLTQDRDSKTLKVYLLS